jgi:hypothetical protein
MLLKSISSYLKGQQDGDTTADSNLSSNNVEYKPFTHAQENKNITMRVTKI